MPIRIVSTPVRRAALVLAAAALCGAALPAAAQPAASWPQKPVTLIVPFAPGGGTDSSARMLAQQLSLRWGQPVIVDNKPGASGSIGLDIAARAHPDGYTLLVGNVGTQSINPTLFKKLPFDTRKAFAPVTLIAELPQVLLVNPGVPVHNVPELLALLRKQPGKMSYSTSGAGSSMHLAAEMFKSESGTDMVHVPYRGGGPAIADLLAGHVDVSFPTVLESMGHIRGGKLRAIAVTGASPLAALPGVPTVGATVKGYESVSWVGLLAPAGTPAPVVDKIAADVRATMGQEELRQRMLEQGAVPHTTSPAEFAAYIERDRARYAALIEAKNISAD